MTRLVPQIPFPPYSYVTGRFPHPMRDPAGHSFGLVEPQPEPFDQTRWCGCTRYLYGIDLFNAGYYWEAHEAWESVWHQVRADEVAADFLKGLIKLAAAGVKVRERRPEGARRHGRRAHELFQSIAERSERNRTWFGIDSHMLLDAAHRLAEGGATLPVQDLPVEVVLDIQLRTSLTPPRTGASDLR